VLRNRTPAAQRGEPQSLQAPQHRRELFKDGADGPVRAGGHRDAMEVVIGGERCLDVVTAQSLGEACVGFAHGVELGRGQAGHRLADSEFVHGRRDRPGGPHRADIQGADDRVAAGFRLHQAGPLQTGQRLPNRRTADAQPLHQVTVVEALTRSERAVDDGVPNRAVGVLTKE
jgi:hypothetical protein